MRLVLLTIPFILLGYTCGSKAEGSTQNVEFLLRKNACVGNDTIGKMYINIGVQGLHRGVVLDCNKNQRFRLRFSNQKRCLINAQMCSRENPTAQGLIEVHCGEGLNEAVVIQCT